MSQRIGILDWGIGGFGVYHHLKKKHPKTPVLYFSDAGFPPYGKVDESELKERVAAVIACMQERGAEHILVACNAAATVLETDPSGKTLHILDAGIALGKSNAGGSLAILGGERTIASNLHAEALQPHFTSIKNIIAQPLSAFIEANLIHTAGFEVALKNILDQTKPSTKILMACTHYPAAKEQIQAYLPEITQLDPAKTLLKTAESNWNFPTNQKEDQFLTTAALTAIPTINIPGFKTSPALFEQIAI